MNVHLFIIWANAISNQALILETLKKNFEILKVFDNALNAEQTVQLMKTLYDFSDSQALHKMSACGFGHINIILVRDASSEESIILTKYGYIPVHKKSYEVKISIRKEIHNDALFHGTMTDFELEHDYFACFHSKAPFEILKVVPSWNGNIEEMINEAKQ